MIKDNENKWKYNFQKEGKYKIVIVLNHIINDMKRFFYECSNYILLDFSSFDSSNITDMSGMFRKCYKIKNINGINKFNTSKVNNMVGLFNDCNELEYLDLSNFNTSNVVDMQTMFNRCRKLKGIKGIDRFNTIKVTDMSGMFQGCNEVEYEIYQILILQMLQKWQKCLILVIN